MPRELAAARADEFVRAPVGRWTAAGNAVVWCSSPTLSGTTSWGRPTTAETLAVTRLYDAISHPELAPRFDIIHDAAELEGIDDEALGVFVGWVRERLPLIRRRVRLSIGVVPDIILRPLAAVVGDGSGRIVRDARAAYDLVDGGASLREEIAAIVAAVRAPRELQALRELLRARNGDLSVEAAARALGRATRSLQRTLREGGTSFRAEQTEVRFAVAGELLVGTDLKAAEIAARLGLSESGLSALVRARSGMTPAQLRRSKGRRGGGK